MTPICLVFLFSSLGQALPLSPLSKMLSPSAIIRKSQSEVNEVQASPIVRKVKKSGAYMAANGEVKVNHQELSDQDPALAPQQVVSMDNFGHVELVQQQQKPSEQAAAPPLEGKTDAVVNTFSATHSGGHAASQPRASAGRRAHPRAALRAQARAAGLRRTQGVKRKKREQKVREQSLKATRASNPPAKGVKKEDLKDLRVVSEQTLTKASNPAPTGHPKKQAQKGVLPGGVRPGFTRKLMKSPVGDIQRKKLMQTFKVDTSHMSLVSAPSANSALKEQAEPRALEKRTRRSRRPKKGTQP